MTDDELHAIYLEGVRKSVEHFGEQAVAIVMEHTDLPDANGLRAVFDAGWDAA